MEKIKYIIIFTLCLGLILLYIQIDNYKNITTSLLSQNNTIEQKNKTLISQVNILKQQNKNLELNITNLQNQILILEENLTQTIYDINDSNISDINYTESNNTNTTITLENENAITGFGE